MIKDFQPLCWDVVSRCGIFDHEKNVLKKHARIGQNFTTSRRVVELLPNIETDLNFEDIKRNGFVFTDGCGEISTELAELVAKTYNYKKCSAF